MKKVNLKEILATHISKSLQEYGNATAEECDSVAKLSIEQGGCHNHTLEAMKEACRQVLVLAAENAKTKDVVKCWWRSTLDGNVQELDKVVDKESITVTLYQVE